MNGEEGENVCRWRRGFVHSRNNDLSEYLIV